MWKILDFNEGAYVTAGAGAVEVTDFRGPLSTRDGEVRFSLRLWRTPDSSLARSAVGRYPDLMPGTARNAARANCILAVGSADALAVALYMTGTRYRIGRRDAENSPVRTIRYNLGREVTVHEGEIFAAPEAGELFLAYFLTGTVSPDDYRLRELNDPGTAPNPTHALTINFDEHRTVFPTVEADEFSAFLSDTNNDEPSVLVLWPLPPGKAVTDLTDEEQSDHQEFIQTAGSCGRYTVEIRQRATVYTLGHVIDDPIWDTEPTEITAGSHVVPVYPHEVFTPAEVGHLFHHYRKTGQIPDNGYTRRELQ